MMKRVTGILLAMVMVLTLLPGAFSVSAEATGGTALNFTGESPSPNEGNGYIWNADSTTLTLFGVDISVESGSAITLPGGAIIEFIGYNKVTSAGTDAITSAGTLTIGGSGVLEAVGTESTSAIAANSLTINGGYIMATASSGTAIKATTSMSVNGGYVVATSTSGTAIGPAGVTTPGLTYTQTGGYVKATGGVDAVWATNGATVSGGYLEAYDSSNGIKGDVTNSGGVIKASGSNYGIEGELGATGGVTILHGTTRAVSGAITLSAGEQGYITDSSGTLTDTDADVTTDSTPTEQHLVFAKVVYNTLQQDLPTINGTYIKNTSGNALRIDSDKTLDVTGGSYLESTASTGASISGTVTTTGGGTLVGTSNTYWGITLGTSVDAGVQLIGIASGNRIGLLNSWGTSVVNAIGIGIGNSGGYSGPALPGSTVIGIGTNSSGVNISGSSLGGSVTGYSDSSYWHGVQINSEVTAIDPAASISGVNVATSGEGCGVRFYGSPDLNGVIGAYSCGSAGAVGGAVSAAFMNVKSAAELSGTFTSSSLTDKAVYMTRKPADTRTLYFNAADGRMYSAYDGSSGSFSTEVTDVTGWMGEAGELTLSSFYLETTAATALSIIGDCTINLSGENIVKSAFSSDGASSYGISSDSELTICGNGKLTAAAGTTTSGSSIGIAADRDITVGGAGSSPTIIAKGGNTSTGDSCGISAKTDSEASTAKLIINSGVVTATAGTVCSDGSSNAIHTTHGLTVTGGRLTAQGDKCGVYSGGASTFSGGFIILTGDTAAIVSYDGLTLIDMGAKAYGEYAYDSPAFVNNTARTFTTTDGGSTACTNVLITPAKTVPLQIGTIYTAQTLTPADLGAPAGATVYWLDNSNTDSAAANALFESLPEQDYDSGNITYTPKSTLALADVGKTVSYGVSLDLDGSYTTNDDVFAMTLTFTVTETKEYTPEAIFTATDADKGTLSNVTDAMKYKIGDGTWQDISGASIDLTGLSACTISVYQPGNGTTTDDSDTQTITVTKADSLAAAVGVDCTSSANNDGKLTGVTEEMQYKKTDAASWTDGTGSDITGLVNGTYYVRVKATGTVLASENQSVTVNAYIAPSIYTPPTYDVPVSGSGNSVNAEATVSSDTATVTISENRLNTILNDADTAGNIEIDAGLNKSIDSVTIPTTVIERISEAAQDDSKAITGLDVVTDSGTVSFDKTALAALTEQANGDTVTIHVEEIAQSGLTATQQTVITGDHADDLVIEVTAKSGGTVITDYNSGEITVTIPYTLKEGETAEGVCVWHLASDGTLTLMECRYDAEAKTVSFVTDHLSDFIVGYAARTNPDTGAWKNPFIDVSENDWFYENIALCHMQGLMEGTRGTTFSPYVDTTRGMIVTILWRLEGEPVVDYAMTFEDVPNEQYYTEAVRWAASEGIVDGYSTAAFDPTDPITREQMATILYRYEQYKGGGFVGSWYFLLDYPDAPEVSDWADEAMHWCVMNDIIQGSDGKLMPKDGAQRCQAAAMLIRYLNATGK